MAIADEPDPADEIRRRVVQTLREQPMADSTLEAADVPDAFLERVADRVIRMDYQRRFRRILTETPTNTAPAPPAETRSEAATGAEVRSSRRLLPVMMGMGVALVLAGVVLAVRRRAKQT